MSDDERRPPGDDDTSLNKRDLLRFGARRVQQGAAYAAAFAAEQMADRFTPRVQRPPGALAELDFLLACTRCGDCVDACPPGAIRILDHRAGAAASTPYLDVNRWRPCVVCDDPPCITACADGALVPIAMADAVMGTANIDRQTCRAWNGRACRACVDACPYPGDAILRDEEGRVFIDPRHCIGCGRCRPACPTNPRSITVDPPPRF